MLGTVVIVGPLSVQSCSDSDEHGFSPLHYACIGGHAGVVEVFLVRGARTDILNMGGDSLLHVAAQHGKYDVVMKVSVL